MGEGPSNELRSFLDPGEEIRWHGRPNSLLHNPLGVWFLLLLIVLSVIFLFDNIPVLRSYFPGVWGYTTYYISRTAAYFGIPYDNAMLTFAAVVALLGVVVLVLVMYPRNKEIEYAVTDKRVIKSGGWWNKSFKSLRWEDVEAVKLSRRELKRDRYSLSRYYHIRVRSKLDGSGFRGLLRRFVLLTSDVRFVHIDAYEAYGQMMRAFEEATGGPTNPDYDNEESSDQDSVSEEVRSMLEPDENVLWRATKSKTPTGVGSTVVFIAEQLAIIAAPGFFIFTLVALLVWFLSRVGFQTLDSNFLAASVIGTVVLTLPVSLYLFYLQRRTDSPKYVVTDSRLIKRKDTGSKILCESVRWEDVEALLRVGSRIFVYTEKPNPFQQETLSFDNVPDAKRAYWKIRGVQRTRAPEARAEG